MNQLVVLSRVLDEVDGESFTTLEGRITLQKRVYLVQALGLSLGYRFAWNQYGPYSGELAQDGVALSANREEVRERGSVLRVRDSATRVFQNVRRLQDERPPEISEAAWLELVTSIHFLTGERGGIEAVRSRDVQEFLREVVSLKPYFTVEQAAEAWKRVEGLEAAAPV